jgi:hypothetical protein
VLPALTILWLRVVVVVDVQLAAGVVPVGLELELG